MRRELGYLKVRCSVVEMDREEGRERRERWVGEVRESEMVAVMAIAVALSNAGGGYAMLIRFDFAAMSVLHSRILTRVNQK